MGHCYYVNLKSVFNFTKAVQKTMLQNRKGSIVNLSSVVGVHGNAGQSNYSAPKQESLGLLNRLLSNWALGIFVAMQLPLDLSSQK